MKITLLALSAAYVAVSVAEAIPAPRPHENAPRYYFPRVVKRQIFVNSTATDTTPAPATSSSGGLLDGVTDLIGGILDPSSTAPSDSDANVAETTANDGGLGAIAATTNSPTDAGTTPPAATGGNSNSDPATTPANTATIPQEGLDTNTNAGTASQSSNSGILGPIVTPIVSDVTSAVGGVTSAVGDIGNSLSNGLSNGVSPTDTGAGTGNQPTATGNQPTVTNNQPTDNAPTVGPTAGSPTPSGILPTVSGIISSVGSGVSDIGNSLTNIPTVVPTAVPTNNPTVVPTDVPTVVPTDGPTFPTTVPPPPTDEPTGGPTDGNTNPPPPSTTPNTVDDQSKPPPTDVPTSPPVTDDGSTNPPPEPTTTPGEQTQPPPAPQGDNSTASEPDVVLSTPSAPSFTPVVTPEVTETPKTEPPQSIVPTGTDNATALIPGSTIQTAPPPPSNTPTDTKAAPTSTSTTMPSDVPRVITPEGGVPVPPEDSTLIQIAFKEGLHYEFVVGSQVAINQIFSYLPLGVSDGLNMTKSKMVMQYLQPYNTLAKLHYVTTLAMAYIPSDEVDKLSMEIINLNSDLYENKDKSVKTLMDMIDPSVPLLAGQGLNPGGTPVNAGDGTANTNNDDGEDSSPGSDGGSSGVRPSSVGIAVGAVAGAAVYGAAMFLVARRYKKRKAAHQRASSVQTDETPRPGEGTNLMTGARNSYGSRVPGGVYNGNNGRGSRNSDRSEESGRSGRTYISPPVMAENSLGWN